jgi:hypothetical protein
LGPFVIKYYKEDFHDLVDYSVKLQMDALSAEVDLAKELGVSIQVFIDPTTVPVGINVFQIMEEAEDKKKLVLLEEENDE